MGTLKFSTAIYCKHSSLKLLKSLKLARWHKWKISFYDAGLQEVWSSNPKPIKSSTHCQWLTTTATLKFGPWHKAAEMGTAHSWHQKGY